MLAGLKSGATKGVAKLAKAAQDKIETNINTIEGEGLIGDALKSFITMSGVGAKKRKQELEKVKVF